MKSITTIAVVGAFLMTLGMNADTIGAKTSTLESAQSEYRCRKTDEDIVIDGKLDENVWRQTPSVKFRGITDGSNPPFLTEGKLVWDDDYLYAGFYFERSDVRCFCAMDEANMSKEMRDAFLNYRKRDEGDPWGYAECAIMHMDSFGKVFLDPDGDGSNYLEFQINPANTIFDAWYKQGYVGDKWGTRDRFPNVGWRCPGLLTATFIDGTLNAPHDVDKGWSVELAFPWKALAPFTRGNCPPKNGDVWGAHLGRVYRDRIGGKNQYWVWPFLAIHSCHHPDRYAKLIFEDNLPTFERLFAFGGRDDEDFIKKAADMGVTDLTGKLSEKTAALCAKYGVNYYPLVTIQPRNVWKTVCPDVEPPLQKMSPEQEASRDLLKGITAGTGGPERRGPDDKDAQPENWQVTKKQRKQIAALGKNNVRLQKDYQWGGEPQKKYFDGSKKSKEDRYNKEVLLGDLLCFHDPRVLEALKKRIKECLACPGVAGIAFDAIGYQNYYDCKCAESLKLYKKYREEKNVEPSDEAWREFSLNTLVDFNNALVDYVHELDPKAKTFNHIWPVYLPEPLYGNRLKMDYCGQTAAWYTNWDPLRIEQYSRTITNDQNNYWPDVKGVAFIGYYDSLRASQFPYKSPAKVDSELRSILKGGARTLMVCGLSDVIDNPDIAAVFKKFMRKK